MRVFADFHHGALYYSFHLLFERRLGWELFHPIGYDWFKAGLWRYSRNPFVVKQFLGIPENSRLEDEVYKIPTYEGSELFERKAITLEKFKEMEFDYIVATVNQHERPYHELAEKKRAIFIRQAGNPGDLIDYSICRNVMSSIMNPAKPIPDDVNYVLYHPEFDLEDFCYKPPTAKNVIRNFVNCFPTFAEWSLFLKYEGEMRDFKFLCHGNEGRDGLVPEQEKANAMRDASFIWYTKPFEGYGFVVHQAIAVGRPVITRLSYLKGTMPELLLIPDITCIDLDALSFEENIKKIRYFSDVERHLEMCERAHERFKQIVNFDEEFKKIKEFLEEAV